MNGKLYEGLRWVAVLCVLALLIVLGAQNRTSSTPIETVETAVTAAVDLTEMQQGDNQMIKRLYGLQPSDFEACVLYYPTTNMGAEELLIVRLRDVSQQEAVCSAVEQRLETQKASFDGYGVEQYDLLTNHAVLELRGNYVLFVVSPDADGAKQAFLRAL